MRVHGKIPRSEVQLNANGDVGETVGESVGETVGEKLVKVGENAQCECGPGQHTRRREEFVLRDRPLGQDMPFVVRPVILIRNLRETFVTLQ